MAALMCGRRVLSMQKNMIKTPRRLDSGFYVLLPEIGEDLPEKNPLLKEDTMLPDFNKITIEKSIAAIGKQSLEFENGVKAVETEINEAPSKIDIFKEVFEPIEKSEIPLQTTWGISKLLYFGNQSLMPTKYYLSIHNRAWTAINHKFSSKTIYEECKKQNEDTKGFTEEQKRILEKYVLEGKLNGLDLVKEKEYLTHTLREIRVKSEEFRLRHVIATKVFKHKIRDESLMKGFPEDFLKYVAVDPAQHKVGPWIITLEPYVVKTFLEYCPDSNERWNLWQANVLKCSMHGPQEYQTSEQVNSISADRITLAKIMGYKNYCEMSMVTKMAGSVENVYKFLDSLKENAFPRQVEEIEELTAFARERGFEDKLEQWDVHYWARKQKRTLYNFDDEILKEYFPLPKVLDGLFQVINRLFNVNIVEHEKVDAWHRDVRFFDVYDLDISTSEPVGSFYLDPYTRHKDKQMLSQNSGYVIMMRNKSDVCGVKPLSTLIFDFVPPEKDGKPALITFAGVISLFGNFGHLLQQLLTRVKSSEVAGLSNVEWDATGTSKHLLTNFAYEPEVLKSISSHYETGEPLDDETINNLRLSRTHMSGYYTCKELYLSKFDLELHSVMKMWEKIMKKLWKEHFVFPEDKKDSHVCSWDSLFVDNLGATYYGDLWSRMLAADIYSAFQEAKAKDTDYQRKIGMRFKETVFALGGSVPAGEVFRRFRGRDPSLKAFIKILNLQTKSVADQNKAALKEN